jgi:hypothetical protein
MSRFLMQWNSVETPCATPVCDIPNVQIDYGMGYVHRAGDKLDFEGLSRKECKKKVGTVVGPYMFGAYNLVAYAAYTASGICKTSTFYHPPKAWPIGKHEEPIEDAWHWNAWIEGGNGREGRYPVCKRRGDSWSAELFAEFHPWAVVQDPDAGPVGVTRAEFQVQLANDFCDLDLAARRRRRSLSEHTQVADTAGHTLALAATASLSGIPSISKGHQASRGKAGARKLEADSYAQAVRDAEEICSGVTCIRDRLTKTYAPPPPPHSPRSTSFGNTAVTRPNRGDITPILSEAQAFAVHRWATVPGVGEWTRIVLPATALTTEVFLVNIADDSLINALMVEAPPSEDCSTAEECSPAQNVGSVQVGFQRRLDLLAEAGLKDENGEVDPSRCAVISEVGGKSGVYSDAISIQQQPPVSPIQSAPSVP